MAISFKRRNERSQSFNFQQVRRTDRRKRKESTKRRIPLLPCLPLPLTRSQAGNNTPAYAQVPAMVAPSTGEKETPTRLSKSRTPAVRRQQEKKATVAHGPQPHVPIQHTAQQKTKTPGRQNQPHDTYVPERSSSLRRTGPACELVHFSFPALLLSSPPT